eukprot:CAMPEP_0174863012 /NCGR_PEP_ID=MMETSP1114-20130205/55401_1 /TAXON_ID=312471 /ORGANISM="Neobodo designis, Strain CCAP 1951/1" /LENGTH=83 /DNA_ID=CAMNT_0016098071 /DNA_START=12 /DNA_END=259 /DNA_ORIENTATION=+
MSNRLIGNAGLRASATDGLLQFHQGLADAAFDASMPTLFCMPTAGQTLFALTAPGVTNVRVSVDYEVQDLNHTSWPPNYLIGG